MTVLNAIDGVLGSLATVLGNMPTDDENSHPGPEPAPTTVDQSRADLWNRGINPYTGNVNDLDRLLHPGSPPPITTPPRPAPSQAPPPPKPPEGVVPPPEMSGDAAKALKTIQDAQRQASTEIAKADEKLAQVELEATSKSQQGKDKLYAIQRKIIDRVNKAGPLPWSPATETDVAEFVHSQTADAKDVLANADLDSKSIAAMANAIEEEYKATNAKTPQQPGQPQPAPPAQPGQPQPGQPQPAPPAPAPAPAPAPPPGDDLGGLGEGDELGSAIPALASGLNGLPAMAGGLPGMMNPAQFMPGGFGGGGGGLSDALRDAEDRPRHHHDDDEPDSKSDPLKDAGGQGTNGQPKPDQKPDPLKDAGAQPQPEQPGQPGQPGSTPVAAAPAAAVDPAAATAVTLPNSSEVRQAATPALAQAVNGVAHGGDIDTEFTKAHLQLPPMGQLDNAPVDQKNIVLGTVGQFTDHRVVAMGPNDVWDGGKLVPINQLDTSNGSFVGWVNAAPANTQQPAPQPRPPS